MRVKLSESSEIRAINWGNFRPAFGSWGTTAGQSDLIRNLSLRKRPSCCRVGSLRSSSRSHHRPPKCQKFKVITITWMARAIWYECLLETELHSGVRLNTPKQGIGTGKKVEARPTLCGWHLDNLMDFDKKLASGVRDLSTKGTNEAHHFR